MSKIKFYLDTSVFGGCFDDIFEEDSKRIFKYVKAKKIQMLISQITYDEILIAPNKVLNFFNSLDKESFSFIQTSKEIVDLAETYLSEKVITKKSRNDALHVAHATAARADAIVSWNFKHIVRFDRIKGFNKVNFDNGFGVIQIISPKEVFFDE